MLGGNQHGLFIGRGDKGTPRQMVGPAEQTSGTLVDGGDRWLRVKVGGDPGDLDVMVEITLHVLPRDAFEVATGDDP